MILQATHPLTDKVVSVAEGLFMRLGVRSITMDEVARTLSMSKKTLYQYFENGKEIRIQNRKWKNYVCLPSSRSI